MSEQVESPGSSSKRRRRRRRSRRTTKKAPESTPKTRSGKTWRGRESGEPVVTLSPSGRNPRPRDPVHPARLAVVSGPARRRRLTRGELDELSAYLEELHEELVGNLYSGMGGQPGRVSSDDRMIQLTVRALAQGNRLSALVKGLHQRDRQALAILVQVGGLAQSEEFQNELILSLGGNDREWKKVMSTLGEKGLVAATEEREGLFFYVIPAPILELLIEHLTEDLELPGFEQDDVRVQADTEFCPPLPFTITTLATYIDQHPPRLTQRQEIFKVHKDEMDKFFGQLWTPDSELFSFHIEFLMMHGMVELRGDRLSVNRSVVEEWLQLDPEDQRDLVFTSLEARFPQAEWVMWAVHGVGGAWVPERRLQALYRRWRRGEEWRERFVKGQWQSPRSSTREAFGFSPLVNTGMLELGTWGQEKFYRLSPRARLLIEPVDEDGFQKFYLTPSFEIMAPAGMAPILFFRIGELAELTACDRANTYKITEVTIEQALEKGWRRDDILEFLRENSQIGLPDNVEQTLRGWMGHHGDVEFHDVMLLTVHRSQIRRLETHRKLKPFLLHRFVPGMYAVDRTRMEELNAALDEAGFAPGQSVRRYPDDPAAVDSRERLLHLVAQARDDRSDLLAVAQHEDIQPENLVPVPGTGHVSRKKKSKKKEELPPRRSPREVRELAERAIATGQRLKVLYVSRDNQRKLLTIEPERLAVNARGDQVLVAKDVAKDERLSYQIVQIERAVALKPR
ncbi:MAG: helicase-associated domain-containing protein [Alphaproteobacteria bacterium]|nr:helicase-associated domain-containing protein [Alphaproteobacteria bacterium]